MAKNKLKFVSPDEYYTKKNFVTPDEYYQNKRKREEEKEQQRRRLDKYLEEQKKKRELLNRSNTQEYHNDVKSEMALNSRIVAGKTKQNRQHVENLIKKENEQRYQNATKDALVENSHYIRSTPVKQRKAEQEYRNSPQYHADMKDKLADNSHYIRTIPLQQKKEEQEYKNSPQYHADMKDKLADNSHNIRSYQSKEKQLKKKYEEKSPMEQYKSLPEDKKSSWLKMSSKDVQQILSMDNVQNWYNSHPFSRDMGDLQDEQTALSRQIEKINKEIEAEKAESANRPKLSEDEKRSLQKEAYDLKGQYNRNYLSTLDEYGLQIPANFAMGTQNVTVHNKPEDYLDDAGNYHDKTTYYDSVLYDAIHGEGAYSNVMNNGTDEEQTAADNEVEDLWTRLKNGTLHELADQHPEVREKETEIREQLEGYNSKLQELESNRRYIQKNLDDTNKQIAEQERYYDYMGQYNVPAGSGYIPELDRGGQAYSSMAEIERGVQTTDVHRIWSFINKGKEYQAWSRGMDLPPVTNEYNYAGLMNDDEKDVFNDFYTNGQYDEALSFLEGLKQIALISRYNSDVENIRIQETARTLPGMTSIASLMMKQANTYLDIPRHIAGWLGDESVKNANSAWYAPARQSEIIENTIANKIGGTGGKIYSNVMNSLSNLVRGLTTPGGGTSKLAQEILGLGGFFLQVDQEATYRHLKDNDYDTAKKLGAMDAIFEVAEEFLPYETMLGSVGKNVGLAMLQSSLSEFGQEFTGALVFDRIKDMIQGKDGTQERADEIFNQGYYIDSNGNKVELDKNKDIALKQARVRAAKEYWDTAVENGLAGFMGGGLGGLYGTAAQAIGTETTGRAINKNKGQDGTNGIDMLLGIGKKMKNSSALAEKLQGKIDKGEKTGNYQTGKLAQAIQEEALQTLNNAQSSYGDKLDAIDTLNSMAEIVGNVQRTEAPENKNLWAKPEEVQQLEQEGKARIKGNREAVYYDQETGNGSFVQISNITTEKNKDGRWELKLTISENGKTRSVKATDLKMTDTVAATVLREADLNPEYYSGKYVSTLLDAAEKGQLAKDGKTLGKQLHEAELIRMYAYAGKNADEMGLNNLPQEVQHDIWMQSAEEHRDNRQEQVKQAGRLKEARIQYKGAQYGTEAWNKLKLDKNIKAQMDVIAGIAQRAGVSVDFEELAEDTIYGSQSGKKIAINVNGVNYDTITKEATGRHHMLVTFGHEFTHWLMNNSTTAYNHLEHFVLDKLIDTRGVSAVMGVIDGYRNGVDHLNMEDAIAEIVAEASDAVLMDENVIRHIQETDGKLYTAVKGFVKDLVGRLKDAIGLMPESRSSISRALATYANELNRLWMGAYDEALSGKIAEGTGEDTERFSRATIQERKQTIDIQDALSNPDTYNDYFTFDNLTKKDPIVMPDISKNNVDTKNMDAATERNTVLNAAMKNITKIGKEIDGNYYIHVGDIGTDVRVNKNGLRHMYDNNKYYKMVVQHAGEMLNQSILINTADGRENNQSGTYMLLGAGYDNNNNIVFAAFHVNRYTNEMQDIDVLYSIKERAAATLARESVSDLSLTAPTISIANALKAVKKSYAHILPINVMEKLNEKRRENKDTQYLHHSRAMLDNDYMAAVESGDMVTAQRMVDEAAKRAGYDTPKLYHGTRGFGFTEFDMSQGEGLIFATTNRKVGETYSGETERSRISDRATKSANEMHGNKLLSEARKYFDKYNDFKFMKQSEREEAKQEARESIEQVRKDIEDYISDNDGAFNEQKLRVVNRIPAAINELANANSWEDVINAWNRYESSEWAMKWEDESRLDDMIGLGTRRKLNNAYEMLKDMYYDGDVYINKYDRRRAYDSLLAMEVNAKLSQGVYELYGKPGKQLIIDAQGDNWNQIMPPEELNLYGRQRTRDIAAAAKEHRYESVLIKNLRDSGGETSYNLPSDVYIFFNENQVKSADPVTYDNNGKVIKPSERFNDEKTDIRWSRAITEEQQAEVDAAEEQGIDLDPVNQTASMFFSRASFMRSEYYKNPDKMARMLAQNVLGSTSRANIAKAKKWIQDVTSISAMIGEKPILDYVASKGRSSFKSNPEYGGSIDSSTICAKRRLQTGTIDAIQRALPNYVMTAEDFLRVRRMMKERGYEVSCGLCFVESSRKNIAKYASQFMNEWNSQHPENQVNMTQINTVLGLEETRTNRKEVYDAYEKFMNKLAQRKPKLFEMRSEYDNDILKHFRNDDSVEAKNRNGGMRINSFSDFEIVHLIDMMQVIMDMSNVGLAGQAYTKVKEFVQALGPTGLKINMSMIAGGVDENGKIIFDEVEGMKWDDVKDLRDKYADNVGTVCVVFTEDQLMAAMADDRIDFIIPFHRSQWNKSNYKDIGLPENVKDFTYWQNERYAKPVYGTKKDGTPKKLRATNYMPNEYWNPNLSGKENAEAYLKMCAENNKIPKFWKWLQSNGDGSFSLKDDGSTDGYWKLLGDFKMYNHLTGDYAAQQAVKPEFDMDASRQMLENYKGGHETFPEATDVVQDFVKEKAQGRKGLSAGKNGKIQLAGNEIENVRMSRWTESGMDVNYWMEHVTPSALQTEDEWKMVQAYRGKRTSMALSLKKQLDMKAQIRQLEGKADLTTEDRNALIKLRNNLKTEQDKYARLEDEIAEITSDSGWAGIMRQHNVVFRDYMEGKTQEQVQAAIDTLTEEVKRSDKRITDLEKDLAKLEEQNPVKTVKKLLARKGLSRTVNAMRSEYSTAMSEEELKNRMAEIVIKNASGEDITTDVEALARDMLGRVRGEQNENLAYLRGTTLNIGESILDEYIAERGLLNEVRKNDRESDETVLKRARKAALQEIRGKIKGSGVRIVAEGKTRFREQWNDLRERNGGLRDISEYRNENDALNDILDDISGYMETSAGNQQYNMGPEQEAELEAFITASANIMLNEETGGMNKTQLIEAIRKGAGPISQALAAVREVKGSMEGLKASGQKAQTWAGVLNEDTQQALKYYNKMARLAAETERKRVKESVIESLKSDHAKAMLKQAEKFREQMANDKKARELAEDNAALRSKISTVSTRMANRIFAETDKDNVPEEAKALVRQVLDMVSAHDNFFRKVTYWDKQKVENVRGRLQRMIAHYGKFDADNDLDWLVVKAADPADNDYTAQEKVMQDLVDIETGLLEYRNAEGQGRISLADRKAALTKVQEALSEIWDVVQARSEMEIAGRKWQVIELAEWMRGEMANSRFKGERKGVGSRTRDTLTGAVTWGNLTPEYFFKSLKNRAMDQLHMGLKEAENRSGLEAAAAKERLAEIAQATGFNTWDGQEKHTVRTRSGDITMTTEQVMALYATWLREGNQMRPADTSHLLNGGFVLADKDENKGKPGREKKQTRPIRMNKDQLEALGGLLTEEQKQYVENMVAYMSGELAELGNEASMKMYGIKKFTEEFYFPIKSWGGVLNKRSDAGISASNENRAAQQGFSKRVKNNASNAIEIGDFTPTAIKHVAGMITYNTVGPAIENMNKVLNQQLKYGEVKYTEAGEEDDDTYKLNMRAAFQNAYGKQAADYLAKFMKDMNGGVTQERTPFDKLLSMFKKNAVAGSLSVAAQQPLSYIRAAMMINPKYLAAAISPQYWKGSYAEMMKHSGVAVIKEMGKFDMNFGQTMQEWITPEGMESKARKAWNKTTDVITGLPGAMDMMTWTRIWTAVKLEQMAENKGMDYDSDEFMEKVAKRFNDLMRRTQVYDSVMTKSQNMRSTHFYAKTLTSFMAEPTLSLNVLADAFQNLKEKGGKLNAAKAVATFLLSAAAQAGAKAFFGAGRTPDKKKNREENFLNKFWYNLLSEANPLGLIPGYRQIVETLTDGEFKDDTMGMIAKAGDVVENIWKLATDWNWSYRDLEDSIGQALQLATDIPVKNIMRDFRAMVNWFSGGAAQGFTGDGYAQRPTSSAVVKYQLIDNLMSNDIMGLVNKKLDDAGYKTTNAAYYDRLYAATASGNTQAAEEIRDYLINGKGVSEKTIQTNMSSRINKDDDLSGPEKVQQKLDNGTSVSSIKSWITQTYKNAYIAADTDGRRQLMNELTKMYKLLGVSGDDAMKTVTKWVKDEKKK